MSFQIKYQKYKNKYLNLKNLLAQKGGGGASAEIIDSRQISEYLNSEKYDFNLFDINYTKQEQESIDNFNIKAYYNYNYNGSIRSLTGIDDLNTFLSKIGSNTKEDINNLEQIILKLIKKVLEGYNMENFLLIIRASPPLKEYDIPRWHRDGSYFDPSIITSKFATVLKGPGTLFIKSSTPNSIKFNEIEEQEDEERRMKRERIGIPFTYEEQEEINERYRTLYATLPKNNDMVQLGKNQGVIFFANSGGIRGAIHSEPKMDDYRIFISIVPGTKENVEERDKNEKRMKEERDKLRKVEESNKLKK